MAKSTLIKDKTEFVEFGNSREEGRQLLDYAYFTTFQIIPQRNIRVHSLKFTGLNLILELAASHILHICDLMACQFIKLVKSRTNNSTNLHVVRSVNFV